MCACKRVCLYVRACAHARACVCGRGSYLNYLFSIYLASKLQTHSYTCSPWRQRWRCDCGAIPKYLLSLKTKAFFNTHWSLKYSAAEKLKLMHSFSHSPSTFLSHIFFLFFGLFLNSGSQSLTHHQFDDCRFSCCYTCICSSLVSFFLFPLYRFHYHTA